MNIPPYAALDVYGNPRVFDHPTVAGSFPIDMGAVEFSGREQE